MNIIETLYVLIKGDTTDLKKSNEEAKKSTKDLTNELNNLEKSTDKIGGSFLNLARSAAQFLSIAYAAHAVMKGLSEANDYALQLGDASRALGVNAAELDAWGNVVKRTGGTAEGFQQSLRGLSQHFGTSANIALKALPKLADVFQRLGRFRALQYGKMLGLDEATILLLQQGRREVESVIQRQKELGVVSQKDTEITQKYRIANLELEAAFRSLYFSLNQDIVPALTKFYNLITPIVEYISNHKQLVIGAFLAIGTAAAIMLAPFIIANAPIILLSAAIAGLIALFAVAYEDVKYFFMGHNSLLGEAVKKWPVLGSIVNAIFGSWKDKLALLINAFSTIYDFFSKIGSFFGGDTKFTIDVPSNQSLADLLKKNIANDNIDKGQNALNVAGKNYFASQTSSSIFNSKAFQRNNSVNTGPITINTQASDAVGVSKVLGKTLNSHFEQTMNDLADGVSY